MKRSLTIGIGIAVVAIGIAALLPGLLTPDSDSPAPPDEPAETARLVTFSSATPREGALPALRPLGEGAAPARLIDALRSTATESRSPVPAKPEVGSMIGLVRQTLEQAGFSGTRIDGSSRNISGMGADASGSSYLIEIEAQILSKAGSLVRVVRLENGTDEAAQSYFDGRFEPFEAGGYYIRTADAPGERSATTNTIDVTNEATVWQAGVVVVEAIGLDESAARKIDAAAQAAGLYAGEEIAGDSGKPIPEKPVPHAKPDLADAEKIDKSGGKQSESLTPKSKKDTAKPEKPADFTASGVAIRIKGLQYYEGVGNGSPLGKRRYAAEFPISDTRRVFYELNLTHEAPDQRCDFTIDSLWRHDSGTVVSRHSFKTYIDAGWSSSHHGASYGNDTPGQMIPGTYQLEISVGGKLVAKGSFVITAPAEFRNINIGHNKFDEKGRLGILIDYDLEVAGYRGKEIFAGVSFRFQNDVILKDSDGNYVDADGYVSHGIKLTPDYETALWKNQRIFFPFDQLHLAKGKHQLKLQLWVYHFGQKKVMTRSNWFNFDANKN